MTETQATNVLRLKTGQANKVGERSSGGLTFEVLTDEERQAVWLRITANQSSGYFSRELVDFRKVESCLQSFRGGKPIPSKAFLAAFSGRSVNNGGFMAAILRAEGLLAPAPDNNFQHVVSGDWAAWRTNHLQLPGEQIRIAPSSETTGREHPIGQENLTEKPERKDRKKLRSDKALGEEAQHASNS